METSFRYPFDQNPHSVRACAATISRYFHTLRYLKRSQIVGRLLHRLSRPQPDLRSAPPLRNRAENRGIPGPAEPPCLLEKWRFRFLNEDHALQSASDWNNPHWEKLWLYNLHYFGDLNAAESADRQHRHQELIEKWIRENLPGHGVGWDPYPTSLRIVNWIQWALRFGALSGNAAQSLAVQTRWLRRRLECHLLGNHLFANAKALVFAGLFFDGEEADRWLRQGLTLLDSQIGEQILADGGHFERSPMYHSMILEDVLDLISLFRVFDRKTPEQWLDAVTRMHRWLRVMTHPDGNISFFNDAAVGVAASPAELDEYTSRLALEPPEPSGAGLTLLEDSGYARLRAGQATLLVDVAPVGPDYLPAHAHADALSFELSADSRRVLVNSGTSVYGNGAERKRQRGTAAHNTVCINDEDSSEVWDAFRVARRARVFNVESASDDTLHIAAAHDGYRHLFGRPIHRRRWAMTENELIVEDGISGTGIHKIEIRFHAHPEFAIHKATGNRFEFRDAADSTVLEMQLDDQLASRIEASSYHSEFGLSQPNQVVSGVFIGALPIKLSSRMAWPRDG
ncbi:MAG: heparinase II/III family protein [Gammaproteobacteria bacterium]